MNGNIRKQKLKFHETVRSLMRRSLVSFNEHLKFQIAVLVTQKSEISLKEKSNLQLFHYLHRHHGQHLDRKKSQ